MAWRLRLLRNERCIFRDIPVAEDSIYCVATSHRKRNNPAVVTSYERYKESPSSTHSVMIMAIAPEQIVDALRTVIEPDRNRDIIRLGMVKGVHVDGETVSFTVMLDSPMSAFAQTAEAACQKAIQEVFGSQITVKVDIDSPMISLGDDIQVDGGRQTQIELKAQNIIAVASGKGGVGKSTVAANLAVALAEQGYDVGLVDTDIYGPSVPTMFGIEEGKPRVNEQRKIIPLERHGVKLLSMGFMVDPSQAVIWRGPMVSSAVRQFLGDTQWGALEYLILDLPPGTGDIQLTIVQTVALTGAVIVSTPQKVALADARKGVAMFENVKVPVLGVIENMAYFAPPDLPDRKYYLFGEGGARRLAGELNIPMLGEIPLEQEVRETGDSGEPIVLASPESQSAQAFGTAALDMVRQVEYRNAMLPPTQKIEILHR